VGEMQIKFELAWRKIKVSWSEKKGFEETSVEAKHDRQ